MARRKISRRTPPLRQVVPGSQGINNWSQANIDQNEAALFNQQFRVGNWNSVGNNLGGRYDQGALNAAGMNQNWGANNANTTQDRITGATSTIGGYNATTIPNTAMASNNLNNSSLSTGNLVRGGDGVGVDKQGNPQTKPINTFSSEIDPTDKTEFQNEVVNNILKSDPVADLSKPVEPVTSQNKLEELYKPS